MTVHPYDPYSDPDLDGREDAEVDPGTEPPKPDADDYADVDAILDDEDDDDG